MIFNYQLTISCINYVQGAVFKQNQERQQSHHPLSLEQLLKDLNKQQSHPGGIPMLNPPKLSEEELKPTTQSLKEQTLPTHHKFKQPQIQEPNQRAGWHQLNPHRPEEYQIDDDGRPTESATNMYNKFRERQLTRTAQIYGLKKEEMTQKDEEFSKLIKHMLTNTSKYGKSQTFKKLYEEGEKQYNRIMKEMEVDHLIPLSSSATTQAVYILAGNNELTKRIKEGIGYDGNIGSILDPTNNYITVRTYLYNEETEVFDWEVKTKEEKLREDQMEEQAILLAKEEYENRQKELLALGYDPRRMHSEAHKLLEEGVNQEQLEDEPDQEQHLEGVVEQESNSDNAKVEPKRITSSSKSINKKAPKKSGQQKTIVQIAAEKRLSKKKQARKKQREQNSSQQEQQKRIKRQAGGKRMAIIAKTGTRADIEESNRFRLALKGELDLSPEQLKEYLKTLLWNFLGQREKYSLHKQYWLKIQQSLLENITTAKKEVLEKQALYHRVQTETAKKELAITKRQVIKLRKQAEYERVEEQLAPLFEETRKWQDQPKQAEGEAIDEEDRKIQDQQNSGFLLPNTGIQEQNNSGFSLPNQQDESPKNKGSREDEEERKDSQQSDKTKIQVISDTSQQTKVKKNKNKKQTRRQQPPLKHKSQTEKIEDPVADDQQQDAKEEQSKPVNSEVDRQQNDNKKDGGSGGLYDHGNLHLPLAKPLDIDQPSSNETNEDNDFQLQKKRLYHDPPNEEEQIALNEEAEIMRYRKEIRAQYEQAQLRLQLQRDIETITRRRCREFGRKRAKEIREEMLNKALQQLTWAESIYEQTGNIVKFEPEIEKIIQMAKSGELDPDNLEYDDTIEEDNAEMEQESAEKSKKKSTICHYCQCVITTIERHGIDAETGQSDVTIICCTICLNKVRQEIDQQEAEKVRTAEESQQSQKKKRRKTFKKCNRYLEVIKLGRKLETYCKKCDVVSDNEMESRERQTRNLSTTIVSKTNNARSEDLNMTNEEAQAQDEGELTQLQERGEVIMLTEKDDPRLKQNKPNKQRGQDKAGLEGYEKLTHPITGVTSQFLTDEVVFDCTKCQMNILKCPCTIRIADSYFLRSLHQTSKTRMKREKQLHRQIPISSEEKKLHKIQQKTGYRILDTYKTPKPLKPK